jgi:ribose-phosphate pyrophosphokinase
VQIHENIRGSDIFIVQPTCPPTNQNLMELLIMVDAVRRASAARITAVLPFFGYARQDRKDRPRVPITAKLVANLLVAAGVNRVLTVDLHAGQIQGFFDIPVDHLYAAPVLMKAIRERGLEDLVVVSPDVGGIKMTHAFAKALKAPMAIVAKNRVSAEEVEAHSVIGDVAGKNVLLVDDLTETAGTLTAAAEAAAGARGQKNLRRRLPRRAGRKRPQPHRQITDCRASGHEFRAAGHRGQGHRAGHRPAAGPGHRPHPRQRVCDIPV